MIANPQPSFTWYKTSDGNKTNLGPGSSSDTDVAAVGKLTLINVQKRDIGIYQVVVSNGKPRPDLEASITLNTAGMGIYYVLIVNLL